MHWQCRDGDYALFFPTGNNADRIGGALCSRDTVAKVHVSAASRLSGVPSWNSSISLRQPIFQVFITVYIVLISSFLTIGPSGDVSIWLALEAF